MIRYFIVLVLVLSSCNNSGEKSQSFHQELPISSDLSGNGALLLTRFSSYSEFRSVVDVEFKNKKSGGVRLSHVCAHGTVTSILDPGVSELDFLNAYDEGIFKKIALVFKSPYGVINIKDLRRIYAIARRRDFVFGEEDVAFYDLAETMMFNIQHLDQMLMPANDISEKGYLNTFNHIVAQAFMTSIFSEKLADFVADIHERRNMPELVTGKFTQEQIEDIENGVVDNYVDIINNEWGQELGLLLKDKYLICRHTVWNPTLLRDYLNDIQSYCSWAFGIGFTPYRLTDEVIQKFYRKINLILDEVPSIR